MISLTRENREQVQKAQRLAQRLAFNLSASFSNGTEGEKLGRGTGSSLEYFDHRNYQPGDDVRRIDWGVLARTELLTVKLYKEEIAPEVDLLIDGSSSMKLSNSSKYSALLSLCATLITASNNSGFKINPWIIKERAYRLEPMQQSLEGLGQINCSFKGDTGQALCSYPPSLKPRSIRIFISDLFWNHSPDSVLRVLSHNAALVVIIQLTSSLDERPELIGNVRLIDSETSLAYEVVATSRLLKVYTDNYNKHRNYWKNFCVKSSACFAQVVDEEYLTSFLPTDLIKSEILIIEKE
jgi:uncharacterized protein (DUF58 family)